jgi:hypothetical protein
MPHVKPDRVDWVPADPERIKRIYDRRLTEAGVTVLFDTVLCDVITEPSTGGRRRVKQVLAVNKAGMAAYEIPVVIDATGDADAAARAGAAFELGSKESRQAVQPCSLCFEICNIGEYAMIHGPNIYPGNPNSPIFSILKSGKYPEIPDCHFCYTQVGPGLWTFNAGHLWVDATDPAAVSSAMMQGRRMADAFLRALKEFHPAAFASALLVATAPRLGVRESRRIIGEYYLTLTDYDARRSFPDDIARNHYWIDIHLAPSEIDKSNPDWKKVESRFEHYKPGESHGIPFRCLQPKGLANMLVPGRSISCDQYVQGAIRVMPCVSNLGEAAGTAAAMMTADKLTDTRDVNIRDLRADLLRHGAYLPQSQPSGQALEPVGVK